MSLNKLNPLDFSQPSIRVLHLTWFAFFLSFVVWFSHAPLKPLITETLDMSGAQWKALLILNVALTIPARIVIGILVDKFGPRNVFSGLLACSGLLCLAFAASQTFEQLALTRFLLGFVGAGFVIGIRMVGEWFPARQVGLAEGIYGGWGNFGSAAAAFTLPTLAVVVFGSVGGWISDNFGRRRSMSIFIGGLAVGYFILSQVTGGWPVWLAVMAVMCCSFFVQAGEGAVFAMVPLVKRRMTGQIAGMAGAYGNVGAVTYLTAYSFMDASTFFLAIGASAVATFFLVQMLAEPKGHMSEMMADGTLQKIELT